MQTALSDFTVAQTSAEVALKLAPNTPELLRLVGVLRLEQKKSCSPSEVLNLAVKADEQDPYAWLALAISLERAACKRSPEQCNVVQKAADASSVALRLFREYGIGVPYQIANNNGVLHCELGNVFLSRAAFLSAMDECCATFPMHAGPHGKNSHQVVWLHALDLYTLWTDAHFDPALTVGERIRIERGDKTVCIVGIKDICTTNASSKFLQATHLSKEFCTSQSCVLQIKVYEKLSIAAGACTQNFVLHRLDSKKYQDEHISASIRVNLAQLHAAAGDLSVAKNLCVAAKHTDSNNIRSTLLLSSVALSTNERDEARHHLKTATSLIFERLAANSSNTALNRSVRSHLSDSLLFASNMWYELHEFQQARILLERVQALCSDSGPLSQVNACVSLCRLALRPVAGETALRPDRLKRAVNHARKALSQDCSCHSVPKSDYLLCSNVVHLLKTDSKFTVL